LLKQQNYYVESNFVEVTKYLNIYVISTKGNIGKAAKSYQIFLEVTK